MLPFHPAANSAHSIYRRARLLQGINLFSCLIFGDQNEWSGRIIYGTKTGSVRLEQSIGDMAGVEIGERKLFSEEDADRDESLY